MAYLGLNALPQFDPRNSPVAQGVGMYQNLSQFPLMQQQRQLANQQQQIANQYAPQVNQANISQTQSLGGLQQAQARSPDMDPIAYSKNLMNNYLNAKQNGDAQGAAYWGSQLNKNSAVPMNMMGYPSQPAGGAFSTNPQSYGNQQGQSNSSAPTMQMPQISPPPSGMNMGGQQMGTYPVNQSSVPYQNSGQAQNGNQWQAGMMPPPVNPNQSPNGSMYNIMTAHSTPKQDILNNGPTSTVVSAPTTEAQTQQQLRDSSRAELSSLGPIATTDPYQGNILQRYGLPIEDLLSYGSNYLTGSPQPQNLTNRLTQGYLAGNSLPLIGGAGARTDLGSHAGEAAQQKSSDAYGRSILTPNTWLGKIIYDMMPKSITTRGGSDLTASTINAGDAANKESAIGNPVQVPSNQVVATGGNPTPYQQQPLSYQANGQQGQTPQLLRMMTPDGRVKLVPPGDAKQFLAAGGKYAS